MPARHMARVLAKVLARVLAKVLARVLSGRESLAVFLGDIGGP